ncbi:hypothetical protein ACE2AJ_11680 [Aquihabitans daechungensis]|uniref:hypothetical protein n=1 Tax=Aquihabitans daechungensis TaxID=1052257 RepID=UPI003B9ED919
MTDRAALTDAQIDALADANYVEFARELARWSGSRGQVVERDGMVLVATGSDFPVTANAIIRLDRSADPATVIAAADAWFGEQGRGYSVSTCGIGDGEDDLVAAAESAGLLRVMDSPAMVCASRLADAVAPEGIELREVTTTAEVADFVAINDAAYQSLGMPGGVIIDMVRATGACSPRTCGPSSPTKTPRRSPRRRCSSATAWPASTSWARSKPLVAAASPSW